MAKYYVTSGGVQRIIDSRTAKDAAVNFVFEGKRQDIDHEFGDFIVISERGFRDGTNWMDTVVAGDCLSVQYVLGEQEVALLSVQQILEETQV